MIKAKCSGVGKKCRVARDPSRQWRGTALKTTADRAERGKQIDAARHKL
jgi:hypothetical protein